MLWHQELWSGIKWTALMSRLLELERLIHCRCDENGSLSWHLGRQNVSLVNWLHNLKRANVVLIMYKRKNVQKRNRENDIYRLWHERLSTVGHDHGRSCVSHPLTTKRSSRRRIKRSLWSATSTCSRQGILHKLSTCSKEIKHY